MSAAQDDQIGSGRGRGAPVLLRERPARHQAALAIVVPLVFGAVAGVGLATAAGAYYAIVAVGMVGGLLAGLEHDAAGEAAGRGAIAGSAFAVGVLVVNAIASGAPKVDLPNPAIVLIPVSAVITALLAQPGAWLRPRLAAR